MDHHFNIEVAATHGVNVAIFMNNLAYWLMSNKAKNSTKHFHENRYWSYNTIESFVALFPYWSVKNIRTIIKNAKEADLIMIGHFSKRKSDRTQWFTFSDYGLSFYPSINSMQVVPKGSIKETFHLPKPANEAQCGLRGYENPPARAVEHLPKPAKPFAQTGTALPYIKPDRKQKIKDMGEKPKKKHKKTPTLLPEDFMYTDKHAELARSLGLDINFHFQDFKDKAVMKGTEWICWNAAFMNWLRKAPQFLRTPLKVISNNSGSYQKKEIKSTVPWFGNNH